MLAGRSKLNHGVNQHILPIPPVSIDVSIIPYASPSPPPVKVPSVTVPIIPHHFDILATNSHPNVVFQMIPANIWEEVSVNCNCITSP